MTKRLKARLRHLDYRITICLDHFEHLKEVETVNRILSLELGLIIVSDSIDTCRRLNPEAKSNIAYIIEIQGYTVDQAFDILNKRAEQALEKYTYSDDTLRKIAQITQGNITLAFKGRCSSTIRNPYLSLEYYLVMDEPRLNAFQDALNISRGFPFGFHLCDMVLDQVLKLLPISLAQRS